jgi:tRNA(Ile)-lysidine synthase
VARANGSYPLCPGFKSLHRHHLALKKFRKNLKDLPLENGSRVLLAYSGGGDSAGMLALFLSALPRPEVQIGLAHINHNLRGAESKRDAKLCSEIAKALSLPLYTIEVKEKPPAGKSLEEWAREKRYELLEKCRKKGGWDFIATAHSMDDQAETLLLRMARGAGIEGLKGILKTSSAVIRPCLQFRAGELRDISKECGLPYIEDSSNKDSRFLRNRLRNEAMPSLEKALPSIVEGLARLAGTVQLEEDSSPSIAKQEGNSLYYSLSALAPLEANEAIMAFKLGIRAMKGDLRGLTERHYKALVTLIHSAKGAWVPLPAGLMAEREEKGVRFRKRKREALR